METSEILTATSKPNDIIQVVDVYVCYCNYGYDGYSEPLAAFFTEQEAKAFAEKASENIEIKALNMNRPYFGR